MVQTTLEVEELSSNAKKHLSKNPLLRLMLSRFLDRVAVLVERQAPTSVLDAGCGEGFVLNELGKRLPAVRFVGLDFSAEALRYPLHSNGQWDRMRGDVTHLPFRDSSVEVVTCLEVLEHLPRPDLALAELARVCGHSIVLSVPNEPWFRLSNVARLKNIRELGNGPGHIQHWSVRSFPRLVGSHFRVKKVVTSFPWTIVLAER